MSALAIWCRSTSSAAVSWPPLKQALSDAAHQGGKCPIRCRTSQARAPASRRRSRERQASREPAGLDRVMQQRLRCQVPQPNALGQTGHEVNRAPLLSAPLHCGLTGPPRRRTGPAADRPRAILNASGQRYNLVRAQRRQRRVDRLRRQNSARSACGQLSRCPARLAGDVAGPRWPRSFSPLASHRSCQVFPGYAAR